MAAIRTPELNSHQVINDLMAVQASTERAVLATELLHRAEAFAEVVKSARRECVNDLVAMGWTYDQIGELLGVTRARAYQIAQGQSGSTAKYYSG